MKTEMKEMWEIFVPVFTNNGEKIKKKFHKKWDAKVYVIAGGLTLLKTTKGRWVSQTGTLFKEAMIPVRISCSAEEINKIIDMTLDYYDQLAIMAYKVSSEVIIRHKG